jgi:hypothetical protein
MPTPNLRGCEYTVSIENGFICLVDLDQGATITNVAEEVIQNLLLAEFDLVNNRVIYQDSLGNWDEIHVRDGQFAGFAPLNATSKAQAISHATRTTPNPPQRSTTDAFFSGNGS